MLWYIPSMRTRVPTFGQTFPNKVGPCQNMMLDSTVVCRRPRVVGLSVVSGEGIKTEHEQTAVQENLDSSEACRFLRSLARRNRQMFCKLSN